MKSSWMRASALTAVMAMGCVSFPVYAQNEIVAAASGAEANVSRYVAKSNEITARFAPIKSVEDLNAYVARTPAVDSPLNYLSPAAKSRFLSSLQFNEKGVTTFSYTDLQAELTPSQIYKVLSLFGVQRTVPFMRGARIVDDTDRMIMTPVVNQDSEIEIAPGIPNPGGDHDNYRCVAHGSCQRAMDMICTSNC